MLNAKNREFDYDETVEESFPASDPPPGPLHVGPPPERKPGKPAPPPDPKNQAAET